MYDQLKQQIGLRIRSRRKKLKMTQKELGGDVLSKSAVSQIELGRLMPSLESLAYLANRLGRPISYFLETEYTTTIDFLEGRSPLEEAAREAGIHPDQARKFLAALIRHL